ncbi:hypothetical protein [Lysinibacillus sp. NPDC047702]|uniref:hypothetical protein n=1 Tax=unclassified Lysinibacillus TaxID=2636778 RepID=UPI003CFF289E
MKIEKLNEDIDLEIENQPDDLFYTYITEKEINAILSGEVEIELEKKQIKNMNEKAALISEIITADTEVIYSKYIRPKFEMYAGYKGAKGRQKNVEIEEKNIRIYNLSFKFKNKQIDASEATAMMIRKNGEEVILLLPDNTEDRVAAEKQFYINYARDLIFSPKPKMDPDYHSVLLENLNQLNRLERCTQSLLHEYGHILHWRIFDSEKLSLPSEIYKFFLEQGYVDILVKRSPEFLHTQNPHEKVYLLKESLVEDYRIWLNMENKDDMFILPNVNTFLSDFCNPTLLMEGVYCMKKIFNPYIKQGKKSTGTTDMSFEPNRVSRGKKIVELAESINWEPGIREMTEADHMEIIKQLEAEEHKEPQLV